MNFEALVTLHEFQLNDTDFLIIQYIRDHNCNLSTITIQQIAKDLYVVPNTIMRLCRKLGYTGFSELKILLKREGMEVNNQVLQSPLKVSKNVEKTLKLMDSELIHVAAIKLKQAHMCYFFGVGDSVYFCEMMAKNLSCIGKKAEYYHNYHDIFYHGNNCKQHDVLFFISASGENERLIELANLAKKRNIFIISLTHFSPNSLSKISNLSLYFYGEERLVSGYNVTDRSGLMVFLRELSEVFWMEYCV